MKARVAVAYDLDGVYMDGAGDEVPRRCLREDNVPGRWRDRAKAFLDIFAAAIFPLANGEAPQEGSLWKALAMADQLHRMNQA